MNPWLGALEALLFAAGEPLSGARLAELLGVPLAEVQAGLRELAERLASPGHGIELTQVGGGYQLVTKAQFAEVVLRLRRGPKQPLSQAALEVLAIIAYRQPVTRAEIDLLRGVHSEGALATLLERELVKEVGRKEAPGRPLLYATTSRFLQYFGLRDLSQLPSPEGQDGAVNGQLFLQLASDDDPANASPLA